MGVMQSVTAMDQLSSPDYSGNLEIKPMVTIHKSSVTMLEKSICKINSHTDTQTAELTIQEKVSNSQIMKKTNKRKRIGMPLKQSSKLSKADLFDTYEEILKLGCPNEIERAFRKLNFSHLKTSKHKLSAWKLFDLKGERRDMQFLQKMMKYIIRPKIAEDGIFYELLTKLRNASDERKKANVLREMSSRPTIDFAEIFRMHGLRELKEECFICNKNFADKDGCIMHTSRDHTREEILEHFKWELDKCKPTSNPEACIPAIESLNNVSSESLVEAEISIKSEYGSESDIEKSKTSNIITIVHNGNQSVDSQSSLSNVEGDSSIKMEYSQPALSTETSNKDDQHSFLGQLSLTKREVESESNYTFDDSITESFSFRRVTSSTRYRDSAKCHSTLEVSSTERDDLTIIVTHTFYPYLKLTEKDFLSFQKKVIPELKVCEHWPRLESSTFRSSDGAFVLIAVDQPSKDWFCRKIQQKSLWKVPFKIQKMIVATVTVPQFEGVKNSKEILQDLKVYNPTLMTDRWLVLEEKEDGTYVFLKVQMFETAMECLAALSYRPYYHFGRLTFRISN